MVNPRWLLIALLLPPLAAAQAPNPPGLIVQLHTKTGTTVFPIGARIQLVVSFQSTIPNLYNVARTNSQRSHCSFSKPLISPQSGWHDPLAALNRTQQGIIMLSCTVGIGPLTMRTATQPLDLNPWVRFDQPGTYTIRVRSRAVTPIDASPSNPSHLRVISEPLRLKIIPQPHGWYAAQLALGQTELKANLAKGVLGLTPDMNDALQTLASLGGPQAARALATLWISRDGGYPDALAQADAPAAALAALQGYIRDPARPVTRNLLWGAVTFALIAHGEDWHSDITEDRALQAEVARLLPGKQAAALAPSLAAVLTFDPENFPASAHSWLTSELAGHFDELSADQRRLCMESLDSPHDPLAGPDELAFVRRLALMPLSGPDAGVARAAALHRWYDLAPTEARPAVVAAIVDGTAAGMRLGFLPDKTLPQADQPLLNRLGANPYTAEFNSAVDLIERYASPAIAPAVALLLNARGSSWPCDARLKLIQYLQRVQPALAAPAIALAQHPWGQDGGCGWKPSRPPGL